MEEVTGKQLIDELMEVFEQNWGKQPAEVRLGYVLSQLQYVLDASEEARVDFTKQLEFNKNRSKNV